jgi:hypothetical protein
MQDVMIKKSALALVLQANRDKHARHWQEAFESYRAACIAALKANLDVFQAGKSELILINELKMLDMSVQDAFALSEGDFQRYVMDEWNWKNVWVASNANILSRR